MADPEEEFFSYLDTFKKRYPYRFVPSEDITTVLDQFSQFQNITKDYPEAYLYKLYWLYQIKQVTMDESSKQEQLQFLLDTASRLDQLAFVLFVKLNRVLLTRSLAYVSTLFTLIKDLGSIEEFHDFLFYEIVNHIAALSAFHGQKLSKFPKQEINEFFITIYRYFSKIPAHKSPDLLSQAILINLLQLEDDVVNGDLHFLPTFLDIITKKLADKGLTPPSYFYHPYTA